MSNYPGYVYALVNPSMPGLVKVGHTTKDPEERALELSRATGVATPFYVLYHVFVSNAREGEYAVHQMLGASGTRESQNREFFRADTKRVVSALTSLPNQCDPLVYESHHGHEGQENEFHNYVDHLLKSARGYRYGIYDHPVDYSLAMEKYQEILNLGIDEFLAEQAECQFDREYEALIRRGKSKRGAQYHEASKNLALASLSHPSNKSALQILAKIYLHEGGSNFYYYRDKFLNWLEHDIESTLSELEDHPEAGENYLNNKFSDVHLLLLKERVAKGYIKFHPFFQVYGSPILERNKMYLEDAEAGKLFRSIDEALKNFL